MSDVVAEIKRLTEKKARIETSLTQCRTRIEGLEEQRAKVIAKLEAAGISPVKLDDEIARLEQERDKLLEEARAALDAVEL